MTKTSVVLGTAILGTPVAAADWDCATDTTGSIAMRKGIMSFIGLSSSIQCGFVRFHDEEYCRTLYGQKNYSSAKYFMKKFLASINICSRPWGDKFIRAEVSTPAMLGNNS